MGSLSDSIALVDLGVRYSTSTEFRSFWGLVLYFWRTFTQQITNITSKMRNSTALIENMHWISFPTLQVHGSEAALSPTTSTKLPGWQTSFIRYALHVIFRSIACYPNAFMGS